MLKQNVSLILIRVRRIFYATARQYILHHRLSRAVVKFHSFSTSVHVHTYTYTIVLVVNLRTEDKHMFIGPTAALNNKERFNKY